MWTEADQKLLSKVRGLHDTQASTAAALGISDYQLSRYLAKKRAPRSQLSIEVLRTRMESEVEKNRHARTAEKKPVRRNRHA